MPANSKTLGRPQGLLVPVPFWGQGNLEIVPPPLEVNGSHSAHYANGPSEHTPSAALPSEPWTLPTEKSTSQSVRDTHTAQSSHWWEQPASLAWDNALGPVLCCQVVSSNASPGWGAIREGKGISGQWHGPWLSQHINHLELQAIYLALLHFLPEQRNHHVLLRTDSTVAVVHINRQVSLPVENLPCLLRTLVTHRTFQNSLLHFAINISLTLAGQQSIH